MLQLPRADIVGKQTTTNVLQKQYQHFIGATVETYVMAEAPMKHRGLTNDRKSQREASE